MEKRERILEKLLKPEAEFSPIPFWFFNDAFDEEQVRTQLEDYKAKGVDGFVLHPRIGVPRELPYLSDAYFQAVRFIVETAAELEMKVVLYDEGMYPSGSAHGMVVEREPAYASRGIILLEEKAAADRLQREPGAETIVRLSDGRQILYGFTGGTIRGIHFGEDDGEPGAPKAADILNSEAVDLFVELTHDRYYEELKEYFGNTVIAFFTDEPSALGRNAEGYRPWVKGLERELEAAGGCLAELEGLFTDSGKKIAGREDLTQTEENDTVRIYHRLIKEKLREIFYARLSAWCEAHGIALMGHPAESDDIEEELYFHIPGQDLIMRRVAPETGGVREFDSVQAKLSADIARHLGRRRNANECFGVCCREQIPWYMTGSDMKWYIDWLGLRGVNFYVPHAFYYSVEGARKGERPPDVGPNNIWWKHYRRFSDYMKRLSFLMTDSVDGAEVAVLCDNNRVPYTEIACLYENQTEFHYVPAAILEKGEVADGRVRIGKNAYRGVLNVLGEAYEARFRDMLGELLWTAEGGEEAAQAVVQERLYVAEGGKDTERRAIAERAVMQERLCAAEGGSPAERSGGETMQPMAQQRSSAAGEGNGAGRIGGAFRTLIRERSSAVCEGKHAKQAAEETVYAGESDFGKRIRLESACPSLRKVSLYKDGMSMLLFGNEGSEPICTGVTAPGLREPLFVDLWRGNCYRVEGAGERFVLSLQPRETLLILEGAGIIETQAPACICGEDSHGGKRRLTGIVGGMPLEIRKADWYREEYADWTDRFSIVEKKDNTQVCLLHYTASEPGETVRFCVRAQEMAECWCNGSFADVSFWGVHRFELKDLREGDNEIRLVITGNAANIYDHAGIAFGLC